MTQLTPEALRQLAALWRKYMGNVAGILFSDILCQEADRLDAAKRAETVAAIHAAKDGPFVEVPPGETLSDWLEKDDAAPPLPSQSGAPTSVAEAATIAKPLFIVESGDDNARGYLVATNVNGVRVAVPLHTDRAFNVVSDALETLDKRCRRYEAALQRIRDSETTMDLFHPGEFRYTARRALSGEGGGT